MKTLPFLTVALAGLLGSTVMAQCPGSFPVTLYSTDFETDNGGFTAIGAGDWEYGVIPVSIAGTNCESANIYSPGGANSGTKGWGTLLNDCYNNQSPSGFNTMELMMDLSDPALVSAELNFAHWFEVFVSFDYLVITANGTEVYRNDTTERSTAWSEATVDLTPFLGQASVALDFKLWATTVVNRAGWYIDDVSVTACSSVPQTIGEGSTPGFRAWPVPASDLLQVEPSTAMGSVHAWTLYDPTGRMLAQGVPPGNGRFNIDVSAFHGLGVLELRTANGAHRQQVMME